MEGKRAKKDQSQRLCTGYSFLLSNLNNSISFSSDTEVCMKNRFHLDLLTLQNQLTFRWQVGNRANSLELRRDVRLEM